MSLAKKLHPSCFTAMSGKMAAIVAHIISQHWTDPAIAEICITSDGFVLGRHSDDCGMNEMLGKRSVFEDNWGRLLDAAKLSRKERQQAQALYKLKIKQH